ncbi:MAG: polymer-forming cytoskeletal protein [Pseudolabrys sp.]|nr:polymer-forming cytoskeletal protein [Pseudolabrys sp.]
MSYFSATKGDRDTRNASVNAAEPRLAAQPAPAKASPDVVSVVGPGMAITGNIVCAGSVQVFGRVTGDIHAAQLVICDGADVEGKVIAVDTVIDGKFKGTIHGNTVKLQRTAIVDGEIYNRSLTIEQDAQFEGVARRLDTPVDAPASFQAKAERPVMLSMAQAVPALSTVD